MAGTATTPRERGWRPAPAWTAPGRFWMAWPPASGDRARDEAVRDDCLGLAELLSDHAPVSLVCSSRDAAEIALRTPSNVAAMATDHDGGPVGEHGPLWLMDGDGRLAAAVARTALGRILADQMNLPVLDAPPGLPAIIDSDGEGTALVTAEGGDVEMLDWSLRHWMGLETLIWLAPPGARFLAPGVVVLAPHPANYRALQAAVDACGRRLTLVEMPNPKKGEGRYADCVIAGDAVVVPDFEDGRGTENFGLISAALPDRRVSAFPASLLAPRAAGLGAAVAVAPKG